MYSKKPILQKQIYLEVQREEENFEDREEHSFTATFDELAQAAEETLDEFEDQYSSKNPRAFSKKKQLRWYRTPHYELSNCLKIVLKNEESDLLSKESLEYVIDCLDYDRTYLFPNKSNLRDLALKILAHYTKQGGGIGKEGIQQIVEILDDLKSDPRALAILTLSYSIIQGYVLEKESATSFLKHVARLMKKRARYLTTLMVALHAKLLVKINVQFNKEEWDIVRHFLSPLSSENQERAVIYQWKGFSKDYPDKNFFPWHKFFFTKRGELSAIKEKLSEKNTKLTKPALIKVIHYWFELDDDDADNKLTILEIILKCLQKGQLKFPVFKNSNFSKALSKLLREGLYCQHIEISSYAWPVFFMLTENCQDLKLMTHIKYDDLEGAYEQGRLHAMNAINQYARIHGQNSIPTLPKVFSYIKQLTENSHQKVNQTARYIEAVLSKNLSGLEELLLNVNHSEEISQIYKQAAQQRQPLDWMTITKKLFFILKNKKYSEKTEKNALSILVLLAQYKEKFEKKEYPFIRRLMFSEQGQKGRLVLQLVGYYALVDYQLLMDQTVLNQLMSSFERPHLSVLERKTILFVCSNLLLSVPRKGILSFYEIFSALVEKASLCLREPALESVLYQNTVILLNNSVEKIQFSPFVLKSLFLTLTVRTNDTDLLQMLSLIGRSLSAQKDIWLPKQDVHVLMNLLFHEHIEVASDAAEVVCRYLKQCDLNPFSEKEVLNFCYPLNNSSKKEILGKLFRVISEKEWDLMDEAILILLEHLQDENRYLAKDMMMSLLKQSELKKLSHPVIDKLQLVFLENAYKEVDKFLIHVFYNVLEKEEDVDYVASFKRSVCSNLVQIVQGSNYQLELRRKAIWILNRLSKKGRGFSEEILNQILHLIHQHDPVIVKVALQTIAAQMKFKDAYFFSSEIYQEQFIKKIQDLVIEKFFVVEACLLETLSIVRLAYQQGFHVSSELVDALSDLILFNQSEAVCLKSLGFIRSLSKSSVTRKARSVLELENAMRLFLKTHSDLSRFKSCVEKYGYITVLNAIELSKFIKQSDRNRSDVLEICFSLAKKQFYFPVFVLDEIFNYVQRTPLALLKLHAIYTLIETAKYDRIVHESVFMKVGELLTLEKIDKKIALEALDIAVKNNMKLPESVVDFISNLSNGSNIVFINSLQKLIRNNDAFIQTLRLIKEVALSQPLSWTSFNNVLKLINPNMEKEEAALLSSSIICAVEKNQTLFTSLTQKKLLESIQYFNPFLLEKMALLSMLNEKKVNVSSQENFKKIELELKFFSDSISLEERFLALESLVKLCKELDEHIYNFILLFLRKEFNTKPLIYLINAFYPLKNYKNWPNELTVLLIEGLSFCPLETKEFIEQRSFLYKKLPFKILSSCLDLLKNYLLFHVQQEVRFCAFEVLQLLKDHFKSDEVLSVILVRESLGLVDLIKNIKTPRNVEIPLSFNQIRTLVKGLKEKNNLHHEVTIIECLWRYKEQIPFQLKVDLAVVFISLDQDLQKTSIALFNFLLQAIFHEKKAMSSLIAVVYEKLETKTNFYRSLDLLMMLSRWTTLPFDQKIVQLLMSEWSQNSIQTEQLKLYNMLLGILRQTHDEISFSYHNFFDQWISKINSFSVDFSKQFARILCFLIHLSHAGLNLSVQNLKVLGHYLVDRLHIEPIVIDEIGVFSHQQDKMMLLLKLIATHNSFKNLPTFRQGLSVIATQLPDLYSKGFLCEALLAQCNEVSSFSDSDERHFFHHLRNIEQRYTFHDKDDKRDHFLLSLLIRQEHEQLTLKQVNYLLLFISKNSVNLFQLVVFPQDTLLRNLVAQFITHFQSQDEKNNIVHDQHIMLYKKVSALKWNFYFLNHFFKQLHPVHSLIELNDFLDFLLDKKINIRIVEESLKNIVFNDEVSPLNQLKSKFLFMLVDEKLRKNNVNIMTKQSFMYGTLQSTCAKLLNAGWSFIKIYECLNKINLLETNKIFIFFEKLEVAYYYRIQEDRFYKTLNQFDNFLTFYHELRKGSFSLMVKDKGPLTLLADLRRDNQSNPYIIKILEEKKLETILEKMEDISNKKLDFLNPIKEWEIHDVKQWALQYRRNNKNIVSDDLPLQLAVLQRACFLALHYWPYLAQLLSVILFILRDPLKTGRFSLNSTSAGKTTIIAMLAVFFGLDNKVVDVMTSASDLTLRDSKNLKNFYQLFQLNVDCNLDQDYKHGEKSCYRAEIVYGDSSSFQFDFLRDVFGLLGTRGKRPFEVVIIDEVDHFVLDELTKVAMIAETVPGMSELRAFFIAIWVRLLDLEQHYLGYAFEEKSEETVGFEKQQLIREALLEYIEALMLTASEGKQGEATLKIFNHLIDYFKLQTKALSQSALLARYHHQLDRHYAIREDRHGTKIIAPIDENTGVIQSSTTWNDGLQQFLQIKHGLKFLPPGLTTNFLSNRAFLEYYTQAVLGLTGTLGQPKAQNLMNQICDVDFVFIPESKPKQLIWLEPILVENDELWLWALSLSAVREASMGRVVLIICECISEAQKIHEFIFTQLRFNGILRLYAENNEINRQLIESIFEEKTIIVATNLGGRGTDIKITAAVVQKGGAHLCKTFLSENGRADDQGIGRVCRRGEPGTAQYVLSLSKLAKQFGITCKTLGEIIQQRNDLEASAFEAIIQNDLPVIRERDDLFKAFCTLLNELHRSNLDSQAGISERVLTKLGMNPQSKLCQLVRKKEIDYQRASMIEHWGVWLKQHEYDPKASFDDFKSALILKQKNKKLINNFYYYLQLGNLAVEKNTFLLKYIQYWDDEALSHYERAIEREPDCYLAYYYKACALIKKVQNSFLKQVGQTVVSLLTGDDEQGFEYKAQAKKSLLQCEKLIQDKFLVYQSSSLFLLSKHAQIFQQADLHEQIRADVQLLHYLLSSVKSLIQKIEESQKLLDLRIDHQNTTSHYSKLTVLEIEQLFKRLSLRAPMKFSVTFYDLKSNLDLKTHYQVLNTLQYTQQDRVHLLFNNEHTPELEWRSQLAKLLPINRYKKIIENKEKKQNESSKEDEIESNNLDDDSDFVMIEGSEEGHISKVDYVMSKAKKLGLGLATVAEKSIHWVGKGVEVVKDVAKDAKHGFDDILYNYEYAESFSPTVMIKNLDAEQALNLLNSLDKVVGFDSLRLHITLSSTTNDIDFSKLRGIFEIAYKSNQDMAGFSYQMKKRMNQRSKQPVNRCLYKSLTLKEAQGLLTFITRLSLPNMAFKLCLLELTQKKVESFLISKDSNLQSGRLHLRWNYLSHHAVRTLVYLVDGKYKKYRLQVPQLSQNQAKHLMSYADRTQQNFSVNFMPLHRELMALNIAPQYGADFINAGLFGFYDILEKQPIPWLSVALLASLAALQIGGGIALIVCTHGFGVQFGIDAVLGGIKDALTMFAVIYTREFHLEQYLLSKTIDYTLALVTIGIGRALQSGHAAARLGNEVVEVAEMGLQKIDNVAMVAQATLSATKVSTKGSQVFTSTMLNVGGSLIKKTMDTMVDGGKKLCVNGYEALMKKEISSELKQRFRKRGEWARVLNRLFAIQRYLNYPYKEANLIEDTGIIIKNTGKEIKFIDNRCFDPRFFGKFEIEFSALLEKLQLKSFEELLVLKLEQKEIKIESAQIKKLFQRLERHKIVTGNAIINLHALTMPSLLELISDVQDPSHQLLIKHGETIIRACREYYFVMGEEYWDKINHFSDKIAVFFVECLVDSFGDLLSRAATFIKTGGHMIADVGLSGLNTAINPVSRQSLGNQCAGGFKHGLSRYFSMTPSFASVFGLSSFYQSMFEKIASLGLATSLEFVRGTSLQRLKADFNQSVYEIKKMQLALAEKNWEVQTKLQGEYARLIQFSIIVLIYDKIDKVELSVSFNSKTSLQFIGKKMFDRLVLKREITYNDVVLSEVPTEIELRMVQRINTLLTQYREVNMQSVLALVESSGAQAITGQIMDWAGKKDLSALDRQMVAGKMHPAMYMATTAVNGVFDYLKMSKQNEMLLTQMVGQLGKDIMESSRMIITQITQLEQAQQQLLRDITNQCNTIIAEATKEAQKINGELGTLKPAFDEIKQLAEIDKELAKAYLDEHKTRVQLALTNNDKILDNAVKAANEQCKHLGQIAEQLVGGNVQFYRECIEFYGKLMDRTQATLKQASEQNTSIFQQFLTEGSKLIQHGMTLAAGNDKDKSKDKTKESSDRVKELPDDENKNDNIVSFAGKKSSQMFEPVSNNNNNNNNNDPFQKAFPVCTNNFIVIDQSSLGDKADEINEILDGCAAQRRNIESVSKDNQGHVTQLRFKAGKEGTFEDMVNDLKDVLNQLRLVI